jgi:hypothetical protein
VRRGSVDVRDGGGTGTEIDVAQGGNPIVVELLDPFGRLVESLANADLEHRVVTIVLDVSFWWDTEGVLVVFDLFVEVGNGVVEGGDGGLMGLFLRLDGGGEGMYYDLALLFFFLSRALLHLVPYPILVLTNHRLLILFHLTNLFTKPRTVSLSICLFLPHFLPTTLALLPISSSSYPRMYYT